MTWTPFIAAGAALGGALVGAMSVFLVELWRQVLNARSAARIIRMEVQNNMNSCIQSVTYRKPFDQLSDEAWKAHSAALAPLLPEEALLRLANNYSALFIVRDWMRRIEEDYDESRKQLTDWLQNASLDPALLRQIEKRRRGAQFGDLLFGRPTFPPAVREGKGGEESEVPAMDSVLQKVEEFAKAEQAGQKEDQKA